MVDFKYQKMFPLDQDRTGYRRLTQDTICQKDFNGSKILTVAPEGLTMLAEQAFKDVSHLYRPSHLKLLAKILKEKKERDNGM